MHRSPRAANLAMLTLAIGFGAATSAGTSAEERWSKITTDHFTILTPASEAVARTWTVELEEFRRGLQHLVPVAAGRVRPVTVVLFRQDRAMEPYLPREKGHPARLGGLFVRANDVNTIMLSLARDAAETRRVIFHEAAHWHFSALDGAMPLWLGEGLAELYATFQLLEGSRYSFGAAIPEHVRQLQHTRLLPLAQLLSIDRESLLYNEGTRATIFYAESWAFVHYLFHGENSPGRGSVARYLKLLEAGRGAEDAFREGFGGNYAALEEQVRRYVRSGRYHTHIYKRAAPGW
ncbi:MAG: DUF1570 domain-containing protein [Opitutaceae bacterium]|nr:DUF1570 domain-containing protein [Opitutaceae bacterium]